MGWQRGKTIKKFEVISLETKQKNVRQGHSEARTWKELRNLLFDEPQKKISPKDFHFLTGALLEEAKAFPPWKRKQIVARIYRLQRVHGPLESVGGASIYRYSEKLGECTPQIHKNLQRLWKEIYGKPVSMAALPSYLGGGSH